MLNHCIEILVLLILTIVVYLVGYTYIHFYLHTLKNQIKDDFYKIFSYSVSLGFILITCLIAVVYTRFETLFIYPILIFIYSILKRNSILPLFESYKKSLLPNKKQILTLISSLFIIIIYNSIVYYRSDGSLFYDLIYYGKLASGILTYRIETPLSIYGYYLDLNHQMLYHYGDLWIIGFISKIFNLDEVKALVYIIYPFLHFIVLVLLFSIYSQYGKIKTKFFFLIIGLLYGIKLFLNIDFGNEVLNASKQYRGLPYPTSSNKLLIIYVIILFSFSLYKNQFKQLSLIILSFLPIFYSVCTPAIAGVGVFIFLFSLVNTKLKLHQWDITYKESFFVFCSIIFILLYTSIYSFEKSNDLIIHFYSLKTYIVLLIETMIKVFLEYLIVFIIFIYVLIKTRGSFLLKPWVIITFVGLFSGYLFIYLQVSGSFNLHQAISTISPILILILAIELLQFFSRKTSIIIISLFCICGFWNLFYFTQIPKEFGIRKTSTTFSNKFKKEVENYIERSKVEFISCTVRSIALNEFRDGDNSRWEYDFQNTFQDLYYSNKSPFPLEIGNLFSDSKEIYSKSHPYFKLYKDGEITSSRIINFLKRKKVNYILLEDVKIVPNEFLSNFNLLFKDKLTGVTLWKLKIY